MYFPGKYRYFPQKIPKRYRKVHVLSRKVQVPFQKGTGRYRYFLRKIQESTCTFQESTGTFPKRYRKVQVLSNNVQESTGIIANGRNLIAFFFTEARIFSQICTNAARKSVARATLDWLIMLNTFE